MLPDWVKDRLARIPAHESFVVGRHGRASQSAARADAPPEHHDHDERLRAMPNIKREANSKVVSMALKKEKREPIRTAPKRFPLMRVCGLPQSPGKLMIPLVAGAGFEPATFGL